ncbi:stalk domain-containing protein [Saccharibacillus brassicae]|uniref:Copper amine oxidase-like N-terminal domain-containing protein n=1 Tax=Saccharibacillus brassicae TaxID=2583377 RepID=A0A4Y6V4E4_SACBS|nr:hypothetical protein [Saccharibacillus brassicae]QDH23446.1 hypothetical protein FFV09_22815 [Saccharibacillus brassicae]
MKKTGYLVAGLLAGIILSTAGTALADQVKSLVGTKVTAEYSVKVDGVNFADKAVILGNKAMLPVRSFSDALGMGIKVDGKSKSIEVSTDESSIRDSLQSNSTDDSKNKYFGRTKADLESTLNVLENNVLAPTKVGRDRLALEVADMTGISEKIDNDTALQAKKKQLEEYEQMVSETESEIVLVKAALKAAREYEDEK